MIADDAKKGPLVTAPQDTRVTKTGTWLRKYKLDEIPQLINVLRGDIALVGPRPEMEKFVNYYKNEYTDILSILPGITDDASLKYKDEAKLLSDAKDVESEYIQNILPEKIKLYQKYVSEMSFEKDVSLILRTMREIFR
jgi:lipopolysaccharide/colanic/teichoic acid biosynthesis glycosyltransferase